jgi:hypothetical protein
MAVGLSFFLHILKRINVGRREWPCAHEVSNEHARIPTHDE